MKLELSYICAIPSNTYGLMADRIGCITWRLEICGKSVLHFTRETRQQ